MRTNGPRHPGSTLVVAVAACFGLALGGPSRPVLARETTAASGPQRVPNELRDLVVRAQTALAEERHADAIDLFGQLDERLPGSPEIAYNLGLAHGGAGDWAAAAERFDAALQRAGDPALRSNAAHNLMSSIASRAADLLGGGPEAPVDSAQLQALLEEATPQLDRSMEAFRRRVASAPEDLDARRDAEFGRGLQRMLEELQQQMEQQQQDQQQQQDEQQQDQQQQRDEQQQQDQQQQQDEQQQQDQQRQQDEQQQQDQQQQQDEQQQQDQQQQQDEQQQQDQQQQQDEQRQAAAEDSEDEQSEETAEAEAEATPRDEMTREEAERLLQQVRDKERRRREQLAREREDGPPVEKDW